MRSLLLLILLTFLLKCAYLQESSYTKFLEDTVAKDETFPSEELVEAFINVPEKEIKLFGEACQEDSIYYAKLITFDPPNLNLGGLQKVKVVGSMTKSSDVKGYHIRVLLNKKRIYTTDYEERAHVDQGIWSWEYESGVPRGIPEGFWEVFLYLRDTKDKDLACIKISFQI